MTYGMLASGSCLLTDIVDQLHENSKKVNSVERLTRHLNKGTSDKALKSYLMTVKNSEDNHVSKAGNTYLGYYLGEAANSVRKHLPEYVEFYSKKYGQVHPFLEKTYQYLF